MQSRLEQRLMDKFDFMEARNVWTGKKLDFPIGCSCGDGWYDIIYNLCVGIQRVLDKENREFRDGFYPTQIKEKYGTLRFYTSYGNDEIFNLINEAENKSETTCEICGKEGKLRGTSWYQTLCDGCYEKGKK